MDLNKEVKSFLLEVGINPRTLGYTYLKEAILMTYENRELLRALTTQLYPMVGEKLGVKSKNVERNMRYAINKTVNTVNFSTINLPFFRYSIKDNNGLITVGTFIAISVEHLDSIKEGKDKNVR